MKLAKDRHVVVGADFAGFPLKEAVKSHLTENGWQVKEMTPTLDDADMPAYRANRVASPLIRCS